MRLPVEWLSAYGNNGDRPKSLLDAPIPGLGEVQTCQEGEAYDKQGGEYDSCFCRVTFLTRLQQFCGVAFTPKSGDHCARSRSPVLLKADAAHTPTFWFLTNPLAAANKIPIM